MIGVEEGASTSKGKRRCKRCGELGHLQKTYNETVLGPDAPPPAPPKKKMTYKPKVIEIIETRDAPSKKRELCSKNKKKTTPAEPTPPDQTMQVPNSPVTRSHATSTLTSSPSACTRSKRALMDV